jgi:hypothetical protein
MQHWQPTHPASKIGGLAVPPMLDQQVCELAKMSVNYL